MIKRAMTGAGRILCEGCGLNITGKALEFDHIIPEALILEERGARHLGRPRPRARLLSPPARRQDGHRPRRHR
ncbi:hypothetical protein [Bosea sp. Root381]|uniref:hypothetical protein n=1 Tax=Bosea sp. Root381 TaxID=1736524 RepID=UPI0012E3C363|nr:hypothetical protein [Bosea sp. Root381]